MLEKQVQQKELMTILLQKDLFDLAESFEATITSIDIDDSVSQNKTIYNVCLSLFLDECQLVSSDNTHGIDLNLHGEAEFTLELTYQFIFGDSLVMSRKAQNHVDITNFNLHYLSSEDNTDIDDPELLRFFEGSYLVGIGDHYLIFNKNKRLITVEHHISSTEYAS